MPRPISKEQIEYLKTQPLSPNTIRQLRKIFFKKIDRSKLWYDSLTEEQLTELKAKYQEWLDAPKKLKIPAELEWLK